MIRDYLPFEVRQGHSGYSVSNIVIGIINLIDRPMFDTTRELTETKALQVVKPIGARGLARTSKFLNEISA